MIITDEIVYSIITDEPQTLLGICVEIAKKEFGPLLTEVVVNYVEKISGDVRDEIWEMVHKGLLEFTPRRHVKRKVVPNVD